MRQAKMAHLVELDDVGMFKELHNLNLMLHVLFGWRHPQILYMDDHNLYRVA